MGDVRQLVVVDAIADWTRASSCRPTVVVISPPDGGGKALEATMADIVVALINRRNTSTVDIDCLLTSTFIVTRKIIMKGLHFGLDAFVSMGLMIGWHFHFQIYLAKNELTSRRLK